MKKTSAPPSAARALLKQCCAALLDKKAENLVVLYVGPNSSITDYLVVATGTSEPHRRALRTELERIFDETDTQLVGIETSEDSGWIVVDAFDVMVHLFSPEQRDRYRLEKLWRDAEEVDLAKLLAVKPKPKPKAKAKPKAKVKTRSRASS